MRWFEHRRHAAVLLSSIVFALGLGLAAAAGLWLQAMIDAKSKAEFDRTALRVAEEVSRRFRQPIYGLNGARGVYAAKSSLVRAEFSAYVASRDLPREFPGVRGFGLIERVPRRQVDAFVAAQRADGAPEYAVQTLGELDHEESLLIRFIEPAAANAGALGLDLGTEALRREAAQRAIDSGQPTLSSPITLVQDIRRSPGMLLFVPVYAGATPPVDTAARRARLTGLLYAPIVLAELLDAVQDVAAQQVDFELFDTGDRPNEGQRLYASTGLPSPAADAAARRHRGSRTLALPGRALRLQVASTPQFEAAFASPTPALVFAGGALASALLALLLWSQASARHRAERLAAGMTADLDRLAQVVRHTSNAVSITDAQLRINWINEGFTRISGYTFEQVLGRTHGELLGSGQADSLALQRLADAAASGTGCRVELVNRASDGRLYWIDTELQPLRDGAGRLAGFMEIGSDVTERRQAQARLEAVMADLARERQRLDDILQGTHAGTWEWQPRTGAVVLNERWAGLIGMTLAELGTPSMARIAELGHPEDIARWQQRMRDHLDGAVDNFECELRCRHRLGHWVWMLDGGRVSSRGADDRPDWVAGTRLDINERKKAEAALRASQAFLDKAGRIGGVGGWSLELATGALLLTDESCRMNDVPQDQPLTLERLLRHSTSASRLRFAQAVHRAANDGESFDLELPVVTAAGRSIWLRAAGEPEFDQGRAMRLVGAFQDSTARNGLEIELRRRNETMRSVLANLPCGLSVFDADRRLVAANAQFRRLLGFPDSLFDRAETTFDELIRFNAERGEYRAEFGDADVDAIVQAIVSRASGPVSPHRYERLRPDGTPLEIRGGPMPDGGFVTTYTDISGRRAAEAEVQRSAQLLRGAIDAIDEAFVLFGPDDRLVFCNDKYREVFAGSADLIIPGASFEQIVRRSAESGEVPEAAGRIDDWVAERVAMHRGGGRAMVQRMADGRSLRIAERRMPDGHIVGFRIDITELVRAREAAEAASRAKSRFLANMSHEIRTPMNAILGMLTLLRKTELSPRQADYAAKTEGAARSLLGLLNDILDFSKVEADKMALDAHPFDLDRLLRDLAVILAPGLGDKPVELLFDVDPALPRRLHGDAMRLQQVLVNLCGNAIKFTARGEVVLSIGLGTDEPGSDPDADAVTLRVEVRDTGIGIDEAHRDHIFDGFSQAETSTTRRFGGTGLGLAICRRLVGMMGGELAFDSRLGVGSCFRFDLRLPRAKSADPAAELSTGQPSGPQPARPARQALQRVLIADDHAAARAVLGRIGASLGWYVALADSGEQALALLQQAAADAPFDAVLVDWQMPGLDGLQTCQRIRALALAGGTPLLLLTASAHGRETLTPIAGAAVRAADAVVVKPATASTLVEALADARQAKQQRHRPLPAPASAARRLAGLRLLVAEDNPNNQQVARELLEAEGASVLIAADGAQAVAMAVGAQPAFDAVLMDLQMPVMDGFIATRRIRAEPRLAGLPIVAMTANAMAIDRQDCLAAGMNDHVGKPFDIDHLVRVLRAQTGPAGAEPATPALPARRAGATASRQPKDAAGIDVGAALGRLGGRTDIYRRLLHGFVGELAAARQQLLSLAAQAPTTPSTPIAVRQRLHALRGAAATLGADALAAEAGRGERQLVEDSPAEAVDALVRETVKAIDAAAPRIDALLRDLSAGMAPLTVADPASAAASANAASPLAQPLREALSAAAAHLRNADMAAVVAVGALRQRFGPAVDGDIGARLDALDDAVGALDFDRALTLCNELIEA